MKRDSEIVIRPVENGFVVMAYSPYCDVSEKLAFESKKTLLAYIDEHFNSAKKPEFENK